MNMRNKIFSIVAILFICATAALSLAQTEVQTEVVQELRPSDRDLFSQAKGSQRQKQYALAIQLYTDLIQFWPQSNLREEALFQIAECYHSLGRFDDARGTLKLFRETFPQSTLQEAGFLFEGEMRAADAQWPEAIAWLEKVTSDKKLQTRASYLLAIAWEQMGKLAKAKEALVFLTEQTSDNPYLDFASMKLGVVYVQESRLKEALNMFQNILKRTSDPAMRSEAAVRAGQTAYALKNNREAISFYEITRKTDGPEAWKQLARLGLLQIDAEEGDWAALQSLVQEGVDAFPKESKPQVLFFAGESYRLKNDPKQAISFYEELIETFPDNVLAETAAWSRLLALQATQNKNFATEVDAFLKTYPNSPHLALARLMRADLNYQEKKYQEAAVLYEKIIPEVQKLPEATLANIYLRWARAAFMQRKFDVATKALNIFIQKFEKNPERANSLWLLAECQNELKQPKESLQTLQKLLAEFPAFEKRESLLWQASALALQVKNFEMTQKHLEELLKLFPKTAHVSEAHATLAFCCMERKQDAAAKEHWKMARQLNPEAYTENATQQLIRIVLKEKQLAALTDEVAIYDAWLAKHPKAPPLSVDILEWLGHEWAKTSKQEKGIGYYRRVLQISKGEEQRQRVQLALAKLLSDMKRWPEAIIEWKIYRANFPKDAERSGVLEPLAQACIGLKQFDEATKLAEQILQQNPEGEWNARGRLLLGDIAFAQKNYAEAAKIYGAVALLIDDPELTPRAKAQAEEARLLSKASGAQ